MDWNLLTLSWLRILETFVLKTLWPSFLFNDVTLLYYQTFKFLLATTKQRAIWAYARANTTSITTPRGWLASSADVKVHKSQLNTLSSIFCTKIILISVPLFSVVGPFYPSILLLATIFQLVQILLCIRLYGYDSTRK